MKKIFSICALAALTGAIAISAIAQTPRPTPTPAARPASTPPPGPRPTPTPVVANTPVPQSRIALIDTTAFGDEKTGIYRYVDAARAIQNEFKTRTDEIQNLENRLTALSNEVEALMKVTPVNQTVVQAKQQQGQSLQAEYNTKKAKLDEDVGKRYEQSVAPISAQIGAAMDQFAAQRGITMTLDSSKLLPAILTAIPAIDLTQAFINEFNSKNPRTAGPTPRP
ncbi:MAG TPA: OmpH family outer membrane protein [Pyrinomonadaceae bacterium]|nr:OmpH family outer membrane protein [Pyrinomonadaceae bacterium]